MSTGAYNKGIHFNTLKVVHIISHICDAEENEKYNSIIVITGAEPDFHVGGPG